MPAPTGHHSPDPAAAGADSGQLPVQSATAMRTVPLVSLSRTHAFDKLKPRNFYPLSIGRSFFDHSRAHSGIRQLIDQDETTRCAIAGIRITRPSP